MADTTPDTDQGIPAPEGAHDLIETDYEIGQDNIETNIGPLGLDIHNPVFFISGLSIVAFVAYALVAPGQAAEFFGWLRPALTANFDWFFLSAANIFVIFCLVLIVTPLGKVRLGGVDARPDYSYLGWFAMLFAAGMGIGLMFFGVLEPAYYFATPWGDEPLGTIRPFTEDGMLIEGNIAEARQMALAATSYHWALHPWAIYAVVALALALFTYNKGLPLTIRSAFYPLLGERVWGWWGHIIDTLAVFATLFGLATSLGFGAQQANAGLNYIYGIPQSVTVQVILIVAITAIALISVLRGLDGGVKVLSEINMGLALLLLLFVLFAAGAATSLTEITSPASAPISSRGGAAVDAFGREDETGYRAGLGRPFYWAVWISWSRLRGPCSIARVSRAARYASHSLRPDQYPSLVCVLWMAVFGAPRSTT